MVELQWVGVADGAAVLAARALFDRPPTPQWTEDFLARSGHHLCLAWVGGVPAGFVTGVELCHPDKGTEMFLYELGVAEEFRGQGIGRALTEALLQRSRELGCYGMWTLTEPDNVAAKRTYVASGGTDRGAQLMLDW